MSENDINPELQRVVLAVAQSCAEIALQLQTLSIGQIEDNVDVQMNVQGERQKPMDVIANDIFRNNVLPTVAAMAFEEEETFLVGNTSKSYEIAVDPLDGSSNLDVCIPTGSIFGVGLHQRDRKAFFNSTGKSLVFAGYALYSSSTELILSFGNNTVGFTLDPAKFVLLSGKKEETDMETPFVLTRNHISCPPRGPYYSLNEAREPDWPKVLKQWIADAKVGKTPAGTKYSSRYICSLVGDVHRTLFKGGWAGNPRFHLRLLYEAAPMAFVVESAGGIGSDGIRSLLDIPATGLHDRTPVFLGGKLDILDLVECYGDVQQQAKKYDY